MTEAPQLSREDIEDEVRALHHRPHRSKNTALRGKGEAGEFLLRLPQGEQRFLIEPVTCELSLRRALWREEDTPKVLLVDGVQTLPLDLQARVAGGEIREITEARRIARVFGASAVSPQLASSPIGLALLAPPAIKPPPIQGATVDLETGLRALLAARAGFPVEGALSEERLLLFFASVSISAAFAGQLGFGEGASSAIDGLRVAIRQHLQERFGLAAGLAFEGWSRGKGLRAVGLLFVLEAAGGKLQTRDYLRARVVGLCQELGGLPASEAAEQLAQQGGQLRSLAERLQLRLSQENHRDLLFAVLGEADRLLPEAEAQRELEDSKFLPCSFERGLERVGKSLASALSGPTRKDRLSECKESLQTLSRHALASEPSRREKLERCRMAARLVAWLAAEPSSPDDPAALGEMLAVDGGRVQEALESSAGLPEGALREAVEKARGRARQLLERLDTSFCDLPAEQQRGVLLPEEVLDRVVIPFLSERPWRKLLLLLVPGLDWASAHRLLETLEREAQPSQGMLRFRGTTGTGEDNQLPLPPLLGGSLEGREIRSRILAGRVASPGQILDEARDPSRFAEHEGLSHAANPRAPGESSRYFTAADAFLPGGGLKETLSSRLASPTRILAVSLPDHGTNSGALLDLLTRASESGRASLVISCGGGTSLAPASAGVLPLLLVGSSWLENLAEDGSDKELQVLPPLRPAFWQLEITTRPPGKSGTPVPLKPPSKGTRARTTPKQLFLPEEESPPRVDQTLRLRLKNVFGDPSREQIFTLVELLYKAGGTMAAEDLARQLKVLIPRVAGFVANASEYVSKDGYDFLSYDHAARMAKLDKQLLDRFLKGENQ